MVYIPGFERAKQKRNTNRLQENTYCREGIKFVSMRLRRSVEMAGSYPERCSHKQFHYSCLLKYRDVHTHCLVDSNVGLIHWQLGKQTPLSYTLQDSSLSGAIHSRGEFLGFISNGGAHYLAPYLSFQGVEAPNVCLRKGPFTTGSVVGISIEALWIWSLRLTTHPTIFLLSDLIYAIHYALENKLPPLSCPSRVALSNLNGRTDSNVNNEYWGSSTNCGESWRKGGEDDG